MRQVKLLTAIAVIVTLAAGAAFAGGAPEEPEPEGLLLWTSEEQPDRIDVQRSINERFEERTGVPVAVTPVTESQMGERVTAAFAAGDLPDVIAHPLNFALSWYDAGILDATASAEVVEELGPGTFGVGALDLVQTSDGYAAVPLSGWTQLLVYRADVFEEAGLEPPTTYENVRAAIAALHNPPDMYGFVAATDPSEAYMMQVFEHVALANDAHIVGPDGTVDVMGEEWTEALEFYVELAQASPSGSLYWDHSREIYFAGNAAMIVWSPFIMDELAGLRDDVPVTAFEDPTSRDLAEATSFITRFAGPHNPEGSGWTDVFYLGITVDADINTAQQFVAFSLTDAYSDTLGMAPEGKFPVRTGTPDDMDRFVREWRNLEVGVDRRASLGDIYADETIDQLLEGFETGSRWGFPFGYGAVTSRLYDTRILAELVRELIDGDLTVAETQQELQAEIEALMD